jgi:hypothetical protein
MNRQRNEQQPFTLAELELIDTCISDGEILPLICLDNLEFQHALHWQLPKLLRAWRAKEQAEAELFYQQSLLQNTIRIMKEQGK